jgi:TRAP-type C4-dicarboxylate transport system permease small subunit
MNEKIFLIFLSFICLLCSYFLLKLCPNIVKRNWRLKSESIEKKLIFFSKIFGFFSFFSGVVCFVFSFIF